MLERARENVKALKMASRQHAFEIAREEILADLQLAEYALARLEGVDSEPVAWGNGCDKTVPAALRYLAENERPFGGESRFNAAHLYQLAREIELMAEAPLYRHTQPAPVVPDDVSGPLAHAYKELTPTFMRNHIAVFERYGIAPNDSSTVIQALRIALDGIERRAAMLQAGNSPVIPDGYVMVPKEPTPEILAVITEAIKSMRGSAATYARVLAAAPQEVPDGK